MTGEMTKPPRPEHDPELSYRPGYRLLPGDLALGVLFVTGFICYIIILMEVRNG